MGLAVRIVNVIPFSALSSIPESSYSICSGDSHVNLLVFKPIKRLNSLTMEQ